MKIKQSTTADGQELFELDGMIDESVDFGTSPLQQAKNPLFLDLFGIRRINSIGIKKWILFFNELEKKSQKIFYLRISPAIAEQMSSISNFKCGGTVISAVIPFQCNSCNKANYFVKTKNEMTGVDLDQVPWNCQHCGKPELEFDDLADDYLRFWDEK